jgi:hypothetical protein
MRAFALGVVLLGLTAHAENVLAGRAPVFGGSPALTDGKVPVDGAGWLDPAALRLMPDGAVLFDLGEERELTGAALQADNNDEYVLELSSDLDTWRPWWVAPGVNGAGLRSRSADLPAQRARYLRLTARGGDGNYSISELEVFSGSSLGGNVTGARWLPRHPSDLRWTWVVLALAGLLFLTSAHTPVRVQQALGGGAAVLVASTVYDTLVVTGPDAGRIDFLRAAVALIAALAVLRELVARWRGEASRPVVLGVLALTAVLGPLCFLNGGRPQFHDVGKGRPTWLHHYDMRTYQPIARFFPELRFDGVYAASTVAVAEDRGGLDAMAGQPLRDLRTHDLTTVGAARGHLEAVRSRFTPERWALFAADMRYFRAAMGDGGFLGSMNDHGGNATPVWFLGARAIFSWAPASEAMLWLGVLVDAGLVLLAFFALFRAYGARTALLAMTVFGALDFYQFGSNWFGAALRHDWLALWCLSLWALKVGRFRTAGALLAWSALIRAFPALGFVTLTIPVAVDLLGSFRRPGFGLRQWAASQRGYFQVLVGAAAAGVVLGGLSVAVFGVDAWTEWLRKVALLDRDAHMNNVAVRTWVTATRGQWLVAVAVGFAVTLVALRRATPQVAVAWGIALVPVVFNPANYYLHAVFFLVVLADEARGVEVSTRGRLGWLALTLMCVGSYFTDFTPDIAQHFRLDTFVLLTALGVMAVVLALPGRKAAAAAT